MSTRELIPLGGLAEEFDAFSKRFLRETSPEYVDVEVLFGDAPRHAIHRALPLTGITYDRKSNVLEFSFESGEHRIYKPREVMAAVEPDGFMSALEIVRDDGAREIVKIARYARRRIRAYV